jgi:hypothetical protein
MDISEAIPPPDRARGIRPARTMSQHCFANSISAKISESAAETAFAFSRAKELWDLGAPHKIRRHRGRAFQRQRCVSPAGL